MLKGSSSSSLIRYVSTSSSANTCRSVYSASGCVTDLLKILAPLGHAFRCDSHAKLYVNSLRKCLRSGDHRTVGSLHALLISRGFGSDLLLSNVLMDMYAKTSLMSSCAKLFDEMTQRDVFSWCTLISGFVRNDSSLEAYSAFRWMQRTGWKPNHFVISSVLSACSSSGVVQPSLLIHGLVIKRGLGFDRFVEVGLVNAYAKCGYLDCALKIFYEIPVKILVTWNAMISGYFFNGFLLQAVELCRDMCRAGFIMDVITLRVVTATASTLQNFELCQNVHVYSIKICLDADNFVVSEFVKLLVELGDVDYIRKLHRRIKRPDVSLCSLLISGYHLHGCREEAVNLSKQLLNLDSSLNEGAMLSVLSLCFCVEEGTQIHANFLKAGHSSWLSVGNALISMYTKFGDMMNAKLTFDEMKVHDVVSWTAIMAGFVQNLQFTKATEVFCGLLTTRILLDQQSVVTVLNACTGLEDVTKGKQIHCLALKHGFGFSDFINGSMINMYAKCRYINSAVRLFSYLSSPHCLILVNVMLAGYCWNSQAEKAIDLFRTEYRLGFVPDHFTYSTVLGACADMRLMKVGEQIHCCIAKNGFESSDVIIGNAIISLYVKCECMISACKFIYNMKHWNAYSIMTLMLSYMENGGRAGSSKVYFQMQQIGSHAEPISDSAAFDLGRQIHASIVKMGLDSDVEKGNALVRMYATAEVTDISEEASVLMSARVDMVQDDIIKDSLQDVNSGRDLHTCGLYNLEKLTKGTSSCEHLVNHYLSPNAATHMHEKSMTTDIVRLGCGFDAYIKFIIQDNSSYMLENTLGSYGFSSNSCNGYAKDVYGWVHELIKMKRVQDCSIILVILGKGQLRLLDKRMNCLMYAKESLDDGKERVLGVPS